MDIFMQILKAKKKGDNLINKEHNKLKELQRIKDKYQILMLNLEVVILMISVM
jgi:hypothetical protein